MFKERDLMLRSPLFLLNQVIEVHKTCHKCELWSLELYPEDGIDTFFQNVGNCLQNCKAPQPRS